MDTLTVSRDNAWPVHHSRFPQRVVVSRPQQARAVARAVCALPRMPRGPLACPADWGASYRLEFAAAGRRFAVVTVQASGCRRVSGAGPRAVGGAIAGILAGAGPGRRRAVAPDPGLDSCGGMSRLMCASGTD